MDEPLTPYTDEDVALIRQRLERLRVARMPFGEGDKIDAHWLATLDAARALTGPGERECADCPEPSHDIDYHDHHWHPNDTTTYVGASHSATPSDPAQPDELQRLREALDVERLSEAISFHAVSAHWCGVECGPDVARLYRERAALADEQEAPHDPMSCGQRRNADEPCDGWHL